MEYHAYATAAAVFGGVTLCRSEHVITGYVCINAAIATCQGGCGDNDRTMGSA